MSKEPGKVPLQRKHLVSVALAMGLMGLAAACIPEIPVATTRTLSIPEAISPRACARAGGMQTGIVGQACVFPVPDAGKVCTDGGQCSSGECLAETDEATLGKCGGYTTNFGCAARLVNGKADGVLCVD